MKCNKKRNKLIFLGFIGFSLISGIAKASEWNLRGDKALVGYASSPKKNIDTAKSLLEECRDFDCSSFEVLDGDLRSGVESVCLEHFLDKASKWVDEKTKELDGLKYAYNSVVEQEILPITSRQELKNREEVLRRIERNILTMKNGSSTRESGDIEIDENDASTFSINGINMVASFIPDMGNEQAIEWSLESNVSGLPFSWDKTYQALGLPEKDIPSRKMLREWISDFRSLYKRGLNLEGPEQELFEEKMKNLRQQEYWSRTGTHKLVFDSYLIKKCLGDESFVAKLAPNDDVIERAIALSLQLCGGSDSLKMKVEDFSNDVRTALQVIEKAQKVPNLHDVMIDDDMFGKVMFLQ